MSLTQRQAFKFGFLMRCADEGLTAEETLERVKTAAALAHGEPLIKEALIPEALNILYKGGLLGLAGGALAGAGGGYMLAKATDKEVDPEEQKVNELIAAYRRNAARAEQMRKARQRQIERQPPRLATMF